MGSLQNLQKFRVRHGSVTELTEVPGIVARVYRTINICKIILFFRDSVRSLFSSRPQYAIRGTGILDEIASFERHLRGAAQTPLLYPFRTST